MKLSSLVSEKELVASWIELKVIDFAVMVDCGLNLVKSEVLDADGELVQEIGDDLCWLTPSKLLLSVVKSGGDHVWTHVLGSAGADHLIEAILDN